MGLRVHYNVFSFSYGPENLTDDPTIARREEGTFAFPSSVQCGQCPTQNACCPQDGGNSTSTFDAGAGNSSAIEIEPASRSPEELGQSFAITSSWRVAASTCRLVGLPLKASAAFRRIRKKWAISPALDVGISLARAPACPVWSVVNATTAAAGLVLQALLAVASQVTVTVNDSTPSPAAIVSAASRIRGGLVGLRVQLGSSPVLDHSRSLHAGSACEQQHGEEDGRHGCRSPRVR